MPVSKRITRQASARNSGATMKRGRVPLLSLTNPDLTEQGNAPKVEPCENEMTNV